MPDDQEFDELWDLLPESEVWVCGACGKTSRNKAGFVPTESALNPYRVASRGWDESCMLNAVRCQAKKFGGRWVPVRSRDA